MGQLGELCLIDLYLSIWLSFCSIRYAWSSSAIGINVLVMETWTFRCRCRFVSLHQALVYSFSLQHDTDDFDTF